VTPQPREAIDAQADELAAAARDGDADAFDRLCALLRDDVWRYCHAILGDREQAFDAAQDTFVRAVTAIRRWRGEAPARVFLLVIARRATADLIRAEQRRRRVDQAATTVGEPVAGDATGVIDLADLLDDLDDDQRQAFVLTQVLGLPYESAAEVAGVPVGTIRSRVHRARGRLTTALRDSDQA
jgi:RNA polymerase sigma-70 factor (ECF subfamily)